MQTAVDNMAVNKGKKDLRKKLMAKLLSLTTEEIKRRSADVISILSNLPIYKDAKVIMAYFPLKGEVDVLGLMGKAIGTKRFCFPVVDLAAKKMSVFEVRDVERDFLPGPFGLMQPDPGKTKEMDIGKIDLVIVPGLAFDFAKNRLGRGAGFYDRFLNKIKPSTKKVGVAFEFQILESLPVIPPFDQKVDFLVTETKIF